MKRAAFQQLVIPRMDAFPLHELLQNTYDAVLGIDRLLHIRFSNASSNKLFGLAPEEVTNKKCNAVVGGTDFHGRAFCTEDCPFSAQLVKGEIIPDHDLFVKSPDGDRVLVNVGAVVVPKHLRGQTEIIAYMHFRRVSCHRFIERIVTEAASMHGEERRPNKFSLSVREMEILELASKGLSTRTIADQLFISTITVQNHFKKIFPKLGVHSRAEAVCFALRNNFF